MSREVFVISAPEDDAIALQIAHELETHQITCWPSTHDTAKVLGDRQAELAAQADARITVVIVSAHANGSRQVQGDVQRAIDAQKMLLPYRTDAAPLNGAVELLLRRRYTISATGAVADPLQDLVRIVKPLAGQKKGKRSEANTISRTLPQRTMVLGGISAAPIGREPMGPFRAAVKCESVLEAGGVSELEVVLANHGSKMLRNVEVELESSTLNSSPCENIGDLGAGTQVHLVFAIRPMRLGPSLLRLTIRGTDGGLQFAYMGSRPLRVSDASEPTLRGHKTKSLDSVTVRETFGATVQPKVVLPESFDPLELVLDHAHSLDAECAAAQRLELAIPFAFLQQRQDGTLLTLEPMDELSDLPHQALRISARPSFVLGRSREDSDLLLWFWPRNEIHDTKTLRVSKRHCTFTVEDGNCLVRGSATAAATLLDGAPVEESGLPLKQRCTLNLGGHYFLDVTHMTPLHDPVITNLKDWKGAVSETPRDVRGCVRFVPITANVLPQASIWLLTEATFGTSRSNGIVLEHKELAEIQGRLHYLQGCFWVENCVDNGAVKVDDLTVKLGTLVPLVTGKILKLGGKRYRPKIQA
jgi:hypothetical protein